MGWMAVGLPVTVVMIPVAWLLLTRVMHPPGDLHGDAAAIIEAERAGLGTPRRGEKITGAVFGLTGLAWVLRAEKDLGGVVIPGIETWMPQVADSTIAVTSMAMPVMVGTAAGLGMDPLLLMTTAAVGASMAFMLPVATPPNAIVFSSGYLTIAQMARVGFFMNLIAIVVVTLLCWFLVPVFLL